MEGMALKVATLLRWLLSAIKDDKTRRGEMSMEERISGRFIVLPSTSALCISNSDQSNWLSLENISLSSINLPCTGLVFSNLSRQAGDVYSARIIENLRRVPDSST